MTSTLKVDQIQLADGSTPNAQDLGLAAGNILNMKTYRYSTEFDTTSSSFADAMTFGPYTPVSSNSTIQVRCGLMIRGYRNNGPDARYSARLLVNGAEISGLGYVNSTGWYDYGSSGVYAHETRAMEFEYDNTSGSSLTFKLQTRTHGAISVRSNQDQNYSWLTVYEVAK